MNSPPMEDGGLILRTNDITSTTAGGSGRELVSVTHEPGVLLTEESQHGLAQAEGGTPAAPAGRQVCRGPLLLERCTP